MPRLALEAAIDADPDDEQSYLVYADWLQQQGDVRGELIMLKDRPEAREAYVLAHQDELIGDLAPHLGTPVALEWKHGLVSAARFDMLGYEPDGGDSPQQILQTLLGLPIARFLTRLTIGMGTNMEDGRNNYEPLFRVLANLTTPPPLRELVVGDFKFPDDCEISWAVLGDASELWSVYPHLRVLSFQGGELELGDIVLPALESFTVRSGNLSRHAVRAIAAATWPRLTRLELWMGEPGYGGDSEFADVEPILAGAGLPVLRHLGLKNCFYVDDIAAALPDAEILPRLTSVDLSMGALTAAGARALLAGASSLKQLGKLDLSDNLIPAAQCTALRSLGAIVRLGTQREPRELDDDGEPERYVSVGE